jgi:hypothetical protein
VQKARISAASIAFICAKAAEMLAFSKMHFCGFWGHRSPWVAGGWNRSIVPMQCIGKTPAEKMKNGSVEKLTACLTRQSCVGGAWGKL